MATHILTYAYNLKTKENKIRKKYYGKSQHEAEETQRQKFETLNYYTMFTRGTGTAITITACIPNLNWYLLRSYGSC